MRPESESIAASIASTPASTAASTVAAARPDVSCVWKWIGAPTSSRSALKSTRAAAGFITPAMSLTAMMCAPARSSSRASLDVVGEVVFRPRRVEDVAGVADRRLAELSRSRSTASIATRMFSTQFRQSKTRKRSMPASAASRDEEAHDVVGIVGVADAVGAAQQHLQQDVRHALADRGEPLPRILGQEAHGDVEGRAAPAFEREELRAARVA